MVNTLILGATFGEWISTWYHIVAIVLIVIGIATFILSNRLAMVIKKQDKVEYNDKLVIILRTVGLILFVVGIILFCLPPKGMN